jgi:hypothetical protein
MLQPSLQSYMLLYLCVYFLPIISEFLTVRQKKVNNFMPISNGIYYKFL